MNTCKECKYFRPDDGMFTSNCSTPKIIYDKYNEKETPEDGVRYWDDDSYEAYFIVGENFGCINFERDKSETKPQGNYGAEEKEKASHVCFD